MPGNLAAQERILPSAELHQDLQRKSQARQSNLDAIQRVLSTRAGQDLLKQAKLDPSTVQKAVSHLSDAEIAKLAHQARSAEDDLAGGLIVGLLALIGLIVVIIVVVSLIDDNDN
jgi:hypothetical protein